MGIYRIKPWFQRMLHGTELYLIKRKVHPDVITLSALGVSACGGLLLFASNWLPTLCLLLIPVAVGRTALNALDGLVARGLGVARPWGEVLNECCDRLADVALFVGLSFARGSTPWLGMVATILMLLSSYLGTASKAAGGRRQYGGVMGKADRMIYLAVVSVPAALLPMLPIYTLFLVLVCCGLCVTIVQRLRVTYAELQSPR